MHQAERKQLEDSLFLAKLTFLFFLIINIFAPFPAAVMLTESETSGSTMIDSAFFLREFYVAIALLPFTLLAYRHKRKCKKKIEELNKLEGKEKEKKRRKVTEVNPEVMKEKIAIFGAGCIVFIVFIIIFAGIKGCSSGSSSNSNKPWKNGDEPWKDLGVTEKEYLDVFNKFKYGL